jgi:hypothetical protein
VEVNFNEAQAANIIRNTYSTKWEINTGIESKWDRRLPRLFPLFVASVIRVPIVTSSSLPWVLVLILEQELLLAWSCCSDMLPQNEPGLSLGCKLRRNSLVAHNNTDNKHNCKEKRGQWRTRTARSFSGHNSNGFYNSTAHLYTPRHSYNLLIWISASDWRTQMGPCPRHRSVQIPCDHFVHNKLITKIKGHRVTTTFKRQNSKQNW